MKKTITAIISLIVLMMMLLCSSCVSTEGTTPSSQKADLAKKTVETNGVLISHACGGIYGLRYTNSLEALNNSYEVGHRYIEIDFCFTSDNELILLHDFESMGLRLFGIEKVLTLEEFHNMKCLLSLTLMDVYMLSEWLDNHTDAYIITDAKEQNLKVIETLEEVLSPDAFSRVIPQVYNYDEYYALRDMGIENIIFTTYAISDSDDNIISFAVNNKLYGLTVPITYLESLGYEKTEFLSLNGVHVYTHTVNDFGFFEKWHAHGLYGIYTDYFEPRGFPYDLLNP